MKIIRKQKLLEIEIYIRQTIMIQSMKRKMKMKMKMKKNKIIGMIIKIMKKIINNFIKEMRQKNKKLLILNITLINKLLL